MGKLFVAAERSIEGPWLLGNEQLEELDILIKNIAQKLEDAHIKKREKHLQKLLVPVSTKIILTSKDNKKLEDSSIKGILKDTKSKDFSAKELFINIENTANENDFKLSISSGIEGKLEYVLKCFDEEDELEIKYELDKWIDKVKPSKLLQYWLAGVNLIWVVGIITILIWSSELYDASSTYENNLNERAIKLIETGINNDNIQEAISITLQKQIGYKPKDFHVVETLNVAHLKKLIIAIFVFIMLVLCPRSVIGIGKNVWKIKFNKYFLKFAFVFIPSSILLPKLLDLIDTYLF